ncbi:MAG: hypothetical protein P4L69_05940 [Desulfosporosinus sp.]|nr:hypothetical protein [Desulfosporosinus sp.]
MARISEKSERYRDKNELIRDLRKVLELDVHYGTKFAVLHEVAWVWTEFYGKYVGCPYWSEKALELYENRKSIPGFSCDKLLRHDHAVPRKIILKYFLSYRKVTEDCIRNIFEKVLVGSILTKEENDVILKDTMPPPVNDKSIEKYLDTDKWARYRDKGIKIFKVEWQGKIRKKITGKESVSL